MENTVISQTAQNNFCLGTLYPSQRLQFFMPFVGVKTELLFASMEMKKYSLSWFCKFFMLSNLCIIWVDQVYMSDSKTLKSNIQTTQEKSQLMNVTVIWR
jgi:hypothetical protein